MTCNCVTTVNENLKQRNTKLSLGFAITPDGKMIARLLIGTEKADKSNRKKLMSVTATYCPFCGVKFDGCALAKPAEVTL